MQWSMPHRVLQVVAGLIVLTALTAFVLGVVNAPGRGRLPGERAAKGEDAAPLEATEATPLSQERIEGPPPPAPLTDEQKAKLEADKAAKAAAAAAAQAPPIIAQAPPAVPPPPPADRLGDLLQKSAPPPEEAPH
jgi:hypothetical protein